MGVLYLKPGASFKMLDAGGFRILGSLDRIVRGLPYDLTVTCGSDNHKPADPHTLGRACDVRTHGLTKEQALYVLRSVMFDLKVSPSDVPYEVVTVRLDNLATQFFFAQLEHTGEPYEHLHFQQRRGVNFPPSVEALKALDAG